MMNGNNNSVAKRNRILSLCIPYDMRDSRPTTSKIHITNKTVNSLKYTKDATETGSWNVAIYYRANVPYFMYVNGTYERIFKDPIQNGLVIHKDNVEKQSIRFYKKFTKIPRISQNFYKVPGIGYYLFNKVKGQESSVSCYYRNFYVDFPAIRIENDANVFNQTIQDYVTGTVEMSNNPDFVGIKVTSITKVEGKRSYILWDDGSSYNLPEEGLDLDIVIKITGFDSSIMSSITLFDIDGYTPIMINKDGFYRIKQHFNKHDTPNDNYMIFSTVNLVDGLTNGQTYNTDLQIEVLHKYPMWL